MKKRSLVVSIAMLLVSAIVLSTSTYAWFSSGAKATVGSITAKISASDGSVVVCEKNSGTASDWVTELDLKKLATQANYLPSTVVDAATAASLTVAEGCVSVDSLTPVTADVDTDNHAISFLGGSLSGGKIKSSSSASGYIKYTFYVKSGNTSTPTVDLKPSFSTTLDYAFGAVVFNNQIKVYSKNASTAASPSYLPIVNNNGEWTDDGDCILDSGDTGYTSTDLGDGVVSVGATSDFTGVALTGAKAVDVYIWVEGQQAACKGDAAVGSASFSFEIATTGVEAGTTAAPAVGG